MDLYAHDELWPLFYTGRCRAIPIVNRFQELAPILPFGAGRLFGLRKTPDGGFEPTRIESIYVGRTVLTTVGALTVQDAADASFLNPTELLAYLRFLEPELDNATPVFLAHFVRVIDVEVIK